MRWWQTQRTNLALCVVALGLVAVTVWDRGHISTDEAKDRQHQLLAAWRVDDIGRIDIRYRDRDLRLEAARDEDGMRSWTLREGEQNRDVDEQAVHAYLQTLEYAAPVRMVSETDRAKLGLTEPRLTITVHMASLRYTLRVGGEAPSPAGGAYVEVEDKRGRKRYVIDAQLWSDLSDGLAQLRSKRLVSYLSTEVGRFEMVGPAANWTLERGGWGGRTAGAFMLKRPQHADVRVSRRALDGWLTELGSSDVEHFVPLPDKAVAGAQQLTLVPLDKARAVAQLSLGGECPGGGALLWRRKPLPAAGCIDRALARRLIIRADALVDDYVLGSAEGDITELSLDELGGDSADIDVARKDQGWHMRKPHQGPVASEPMTRWLKQLIAAKGVPVTAAEGSDLAALGLAPARARLRIIALPERGVAQADQRVEQLDVGQPRDGFVYVKRHDDGALLKLAEDVGSAFVPRASTLRPTQLADIPREQVTAMRIGCGKPEQYLTRDARGAWTLVTPRNVGLDVDIGLANELADNLRTLSALQWAADTPSALHALDKPWCSLALETSQAGDKRWMSVRVGGETRGGYFAQLNDEQAVFVLPRAVVNRAGAWLLDRAALLVDFGRVTAVQLRAGDSTLKLSKQGDRWFVSDNPSSQLGVRIGHALEQLLAEGVVRVGPVRAQDGFTPPRLRIDIQLKGQTEPVVIRIGNNTTFEQRDVALVVRDGVPATLAVSRARLAPLVDAM